MTPEEGKTGGIEEGGERREFLKYLKGGAAAVAAQAAQGALDRLAETLSAQGQANPAGLEYRTPARRRILLDFLRRLGEPTLEHISRAHLPLAQVRIQETCSLCDRCSRFCPTGALRSTTRDGTKGIEFWLSLCTGCGLCRLACADGALAWSDTIKTAGLIAREAQRLFSRGAYTCAICGQTFGAPAPRRYCSYCERKLQLRNAPW